MAVVNRTKDASEQKREFEAKTGLVALGAASGVTGIVTFIPYASTIEAAQLAAFGVSGSPTVKLMLNRFVVGAGATAWAISADAAPVAFGTSGLAASGVSLLASGSTLMMCMAGDVIQYQVSGTTTALSGMAISMVVKPLQDIKTFFNLA